MARKRRKKKNMFVWFIASIFDALLWLVKIIALGLFYAAKYVIKAFVWLFNKLFSGFKSETKTKTKKVKETGLKVPAVFSALNIAANIKGNFKEFEKRLLNQSLIMTVVGRRGSGKSALGFRLLENIHSKTKRPCFALGVKQAILPNWIDSISSIDEAADSGVILVDEGAVTFSSRKSMSKQNKELSDLLAIARHKDLTLILVTQNTGMIDKTVLNLTDVIMVKEGSLLQQKMERNVMKDLYQTATKKFNQTPVSQRNAHFYLFDSTTEAFCNTVLPSFWSDKVSKSRGK